MYAGKKAHPPSILRKKPPGSSVGNQDKQAEKRVRFQDPEEIIVHDISHSNDRSASEMLNNSGEKTTDIVHTKYFFVCMFSMLTVNQQRKTAFF
ncbi:uncharacterized protein LOC115089772 isoform X3 [Rhinatrema bivittatum]|uniref:uncharacterized protein LOC115089772 isoform X3 n=1 Tax=Rhinatrema bivittatum TaxID=194408 RepID=UPI0011287660|nr:uncharacterized protein LOC115089772 isoform X3 [Rhinatrema bivittatum]